jgi:hypothetical protein
VDHFGRGAWGQIPEIYGTDIGATKTFRSSTPDAKIYKKIKIKINLLGLGSLYRILAFV